MKTLLSLKPGHSAKIVGYDNLNNSLLRRICDLGLTKGQKVVITSRSLLKKALLVEVRGYLLSLKSDIAKGVIVE